MTDPAKPLPRAAKGTVIRKQAIALYEKEIRDLLVASPSGLQAQVLMPPRYETVTESTDIKGIFPPETWEQADVLSWLVELAASVSDGRVPDTDVSLLEQGFDR